jgi:hypothetical protein
LPCSRDEALLLLLPLSGICQTCPLLARTRRPGAAVVTGANPTPKWEPSQANLNATLITEFQHIILSTNTLVLLMPPANFPGMLEVARRRC